MRDLLFPSSPVHRGALAESARLAGRAWVMECRAIVGMYETADPDAVDFVHGDVAGTLHLSPRTAQGKANTAIGLMAQPRLVAAVEAGQLGVPHAMAVLDEISHLDPPTATQVVNAVLGDEPELEATPAELRKAVKRAAITVDADAARKRHEEAKKQAGVRSRPGVDGMGQVVIDCTATEAATIVAAARNRASVMTFDDPDLTEGQKQVAALLHTLGCDRVGVQAVLECPVERAVDLHAAASSGVWGLDVRMPVAVALGLSDHPAVLAGYGPIGADQARALLPAADLVKACVDSTTGEVLAVDRPVRAKTWQAGAPQLAAALRAELDAGLVLQRPYVVPGSRPRDEYALTASGESLLPALVALSSWARDDPGAPDLQDVSYHHSRCGGRLAARLVCECGEHVTSGDDVVASVNRWESA